MREKRLLLIWRMTAKDSVITCTQNHPIQLESLQSRTELASIFSQPPLTTLYVCDTNIRDMLVRSKLHQPATITPETTPFNQAKYGTCPFICASTNVPGPNLPKSQMNIMKQLTLHQ